MEANHYRFESDLKMFVNLNGSTENLQRQQRLLQDKIAKLTMDLSVITEEIVSRKRGESERILPGHQGAEQVAQEVQD